MTTMRAAQDLKDADRPRFGRGMPAAGATADLADLKEKRATAEVLLGVYHGMTLPSAEEVRVGTPGCQRCEVLPLPIRGPGTLLLSLPHTYTLGKVLAFLVDSPWVHSEREGTVSIAVPQGSLAPLLSPLMERLSSVEARDTRATFQPAGQPARPADAFAIDALPEFVARVRSDWLLDILRGRRLQTVFQPLVRTRWPGDGDGWEVYGHECLLRAEGEDGPVMPGPMIEAARAAGLVFQLDLAARRAAIMGAAAHGLSGKVFINFTPTAIYNPVSCLDSTVRLVDEVGLAREQVVFEVVESERLPELRHLERIVAYYRERGFGVALDDIGAGFASLTALLAVRPDYVKLDMGLVRNVHLDRAKGLVARKLVEAARELGMCTIAEGIEQPEELAWCAEQGVDLVQGYLVARPVAPPLF